MEREVGEVQLCLRGKAADEAREVTLRLREEVENVQRLRAPSHDVEYGLN